MMKSLNIEGKEKGVISLLYGQADYVHRLFAYLKSISPKEKLYSISFPLLNEKPDNTAFDFSCYDDGLLKYPIDTKIIVALSLKHHAAAKEHLEQLGFSNLVFYDAYMDNKLKGIFFRSLYGTQGKPFVTIKELAQSGFMEVYMAKSIKDKDVDSSKRFTDSPYIIPIQVGAVLTGERIADVLDSTGDNISERNRRYSEMTAFYWMWKNAKAKYLGICHYRRFWTDLHLIAAVLHDGDIDAVLPLPTLCEHSVHEDYLLKYIPTVWQPMMEVMKRRSPDYYEAAQEIFKGKIFYASNMCILRRKVLDDLCEWMFPIVMEVEEIVGDIEDPYYNRYAGFCTERLITLYFLYNKHRWKIAHAEKVFIG